MLDRLRNSRLTRTALLAAALFTVAASVGLHPEPLSGSLLSAHRGMASAHTDEPAHACPACLTHTAALVPPRAGLTAARSDAEVLEPRFDSVFAGRSAGRDLSGRSPPSRS